MAEGTHWWHHRLVWRLKGQVARGRIVSAQDPWILFLFQDGDLTTKELCTHHKAWLWNLWQESLWAYGIELPWAPITHYGSVSDAQSAHSSFLSGSTTGWDSNSPYYAGVFEWHNSGSQAHWGGGFYLLVNWLYNPHQVSKIEHVAISHTQQLHWHPTILTEGHINSYVQQTRGTTVYIPGGNRLAFGRKINLIGSTLARDLDGALRVRFQNLAQDNFHFGLVHLSYYLTEPVVDSSWEIRLLISVVEDDMTPVVLFKAVLSTYEGQTQSMCHLFSTSKLSFRRQDWTLFVDLRVNCVPVTTMDTNWVLPVGGGWPWFHQLLDGGGKPCWCFWSEDYGMCGRKSANAQLPDLDPSLATRDTGWPTILV